MGFGDRVKITITEIMGSGVCPLGFKPGDSWEIHGEKMTIILKRVVVIRLIRLFSN